MKIALLINEFASYKFICEGLQYAKSDAQIHGNEIEKFWSHHEIPLPHWTRFAHILFLMQPTSACVERAFSLLKYIYGNQQQSALMDLVELQLMLRYNRSRFWGEDGEDDISEMF
jgi:hypothetical protein